MTDAIPKCEKCGSEKVFSLAGLIVPDAWQCPLDPKDCRVAELERQLKEAKAEAAILSRYQLSLSDALAARDAALKARDEAADQVVELRDALKHEMVCRECGEMGCGSCASCTSSGALSNTCAHAAQRKREIQMEAVEAFISTLESELPKVGYQSANGYFRTGAFKPYHVEAIVEHIRAAILDTKGSI